MAVIIKKKYTMKNARKRRELRKYAKVIMRVARSVELEFDEHIIMLIYKDLDLEFQRDISMPSLIIKLFDFLQSLDDKKNI
jgi:hypothetical protein